VLDFSQVVSVSKTDSAEGRTSLKLSSGVF